MKLLEESYLRLIMRGMKMPQKVGTNPLENSMWENMIDGALKALEVVAIASFDWKLTGIVKLLQSWLKDKREEKRQRQIQIQYGYNYELTNPDGYRDLGSGTYY